MKSNKNLKEFLIAIGQIFLWIIGTIIVMGSARMFAKWFVPQAVAQFPFLIYLSPFFTVAVFALFLSKRLREKTKKVFLNLVKKLYKIISQAIKKISIKELLFPENKFGRFVANVLFIPFWLLIWSLFDAHYEWSYYIDYDDEFFRFCLVYFFLIAPMFFYTRYLWFEKSRNRIFYGLFDKLKFNLKQFKTEVLHTTSNADELKKYAELRDQGIITEEEFQAKKKQLLDL